MIDHPDPGDPPNFFVYLRFEEPVATLISGGNPRATHVDHDNTRYFILRDLAGDGCPTGTVGGCPARAKRLEGGSWLLSIRAIDAGDEEEVHRRLHENCGGAV